MWSFSKDSSLNRLNAIYYEADNLNNAIPYYLQFTPNGIMYNDASYNSLSSYNPLKLL